LTILGSCPMSQFLTPNLSNPLISKNPFSILRYRLSIHLHMIYRAMAKATLAWCNMVPATLIDRWAVCQGFNLTIFPVCICICGHRGMMLHISNGCAIIRVLCPTLLSRSPWRDVAHGS
jgi:hypothetical protein